MRELLNGEWTFKQADTNNWLEAEVPGCNYLDLMKNNSIPDPFYKTNERVVQWVGEKDWIFKKDFEVIESRLKTDRIFLCFDQIDTVADIFLNGEKIAYVENCHIGYRFEIKNLLLLGKNSLEIYFYSPINYVNNKQNIEKCPHNSNGLTGIPHIRKPQCHFGWDWGPVLPCSGISKDVYLEFVNVAEIVDVRITQTHNDGITVTVEATVDNFENKKISSKISLITPDKLLKEEIIEQKCDIKVVFGIDKPDLWQPNGLTEREIQPLYTVKVELYHDNVLLSSVTKKIGLRTVELNTEKDSYGKNFQFVVNGNPIFMKGANWIPADSFNTRVTKEIIDEYIKIAVNSNFNMIRVWGGGYYESEYFYEQCDKYGIMVWQDFMFACQPYPFFDDGFRINVEREIIYNVKRLSNHASLALWCGNNEIEVMSPAWLNRKKFVEWTEKYFYRILPEIIRKYDDVTPYIAGTPIGYSHNKGVSSDNVGDTHLWAVWHGLLNLQYYRKRNTRFCSEFGFESLPDVKCMEKFADKSDYSLESEVFSSHQKCMSGNKKMQFYIASNYRLPNDFFSYIYLSNVCQAKCVKDATEHWRRNKGRCNGSLYWQFNDCWPACSWSGIDYYRNYKALQYETKKFFAPTIVSIEDGKKYIKVHAINDTLDTKNIKVKVRLIDFDKGDIFEEILEQNIEKLQSVNLKEYKVKDFKRLTDLKNSVFVADLFIEDKLINRKTVLFDKEKNINLKPAVITADIVKVEENAEITLKSESYVRNLCLMSKLVSKPFSDNYFDLLPNEEITVTQEIGDIPIEKIKENFDTFDVGKITPANYKLKDLLIKAKIFFIPINFFSYIYYKWIILD